MSVRQRARAIAAELASPIQDWRQAWQALSLVERATTIILAIMIVGGVVLRVRNIGFPPRLTFDEHHFVPNARHFLLGQADDNDHPPLGKLFIAVGMLLLGDNSTGWRAASLIFGLQTLVIAGALARTLFADRRAGWFAAAFFAADGFFLSYSRTALLDCSLTCLVLWSFLAAVTAQTWRGVLACAVLVGLAASVKWSGGVAVLPAVVAILVLRRAPRWSLLLFAAAPIVHVALWLAALALSGQPADPRALFTLMHALLRHHIEIGRVPNGLASPWYTWPLLFRPIVVKLADHGTGHTYASSVANPLLFFSATATILTVLVAGMVAWARARKARERVATILVAHLPISPAALRAIALLTIGWFAMIAPWTVGRSLGTYMYHYLPSYGFALTLVAGLAAQLERRFPRAVLVYVTLVLSIGIFFAPVWAEFPMKEAVAYRRLIFGAWQP